MVHPLSLTGGHGEAVENAARLAAILCRVLASGKPALIELYRDSEQTTLYAPIAQLQTAVSLREVELPFWADKSAQDLGRTTSVRAVPVHIATAASSSYPAAVT